VGVERSSVDARTSSSRGTNRRSRTTVAIAGFAAAALVLGACGGDDDDAGDATTTTLSSAQPQQTTTTRAAATTVAPTTTTLPPLELVTEGAIVMVANASRINGAAGRMTDQLEVVGFTMEEAGNSTEGPLETSKIYYDPENERALPVAESLKLALGGGAIEVLELTVPAPTDTGEIGEATVLLAMGNDTADKTLDELQGRVVTTTTTATATETTAPSEETGEETGEETSEETGEETSEDTGEDG
jgi:hypothetical protein